MASRMPRTMACRLVPPRTPRMLARRAPSRSRPAPASLKFLRGVAPPCSWPRARWAPPRAARACRCWWPVMPGWPRPVLRLRGDVGDLASGHGRCRVGRPGERGCGRGLRTLPDRQVGAAACCGDTRPSDDDRCEESRAHVRLTLHAPEHASPVPRLDSAFSSRSSDRSPRDCKHCHEPRTCLPPDVHPGRVATPGGGPTAAAAACRCRAEGYSCIEPVAMNRWCISKHLDRSCRRCPMVAVSRYRCR